MPAASTEAAEPAAAEASSAAAVAGSYDGPALPQRRIEVDSNSGYVPEPTREDEDGNRVHTSISEKWKVYDSEPVPWTDEERKVGGRWVGG